MTLFLGSVLCLFWSCFFSGIEMALVRSHKSRLRHLMSRERFDFMLDILNHPQRMLTIILLGNNLTIVIGSLLGQSLFEQSFGNQNDLLAFCIITTTFFMLAELLPKKVFQVYPEETVNLCFSLLHFSFKILSPFERLFRVLMIIFVGKRKILNKISSVSKEEFIRLLQEKTQEGIFNHKEEAMMMKGIACESILAESASVPLGQIPVIEEDCLVESLKRIKTVPESEAVIVSDARGKKKGLLVLKKSILLTHKLSLSDALFNFDILPKTEWGDSILNALEKMNQSHYDLILTTDETGNMNGILTKRKILSYLLNDSLTDMKTEAESRDYE